ncbi:hypothetical protein CGZ93_09790 [Enemella dayhoffiae]|uniref:Solute-binding protein family 5 domain-containing protein n=1 Tax=Enemella dayhoffiae TaxID=2016507 RepID=A0A255H3A0_9ACTN|nr:ABC transporter substrate-binding protein [Enemella dayhoffiae]OYO22171.1 hypothetical protein CGZ93_09790 [Enemella dayhoffiae]
MRGRVALAGVLTMLLVLTGCSPVRPSVAASARAIKSGPAGQVAFQLPERVSSFTPFAGADTAESMLAGAQFQTLLVSADGRMVPRLAESWGTVDAGSRLIITLDREAWSDGTRVSAADVVFTIEQHLRPANRSPLASALRQIKGASEYAEGRADRVSGLVADSHRSLVLDLVAPNPFYIDHLTQLMVLPAHVYRGQDLSDPKAFAAPRVGSGTYLFDRWENDGRVVLKPNPQVQPYTRLTQVIGVPVAPGQALDRLRDGTLQFAADLPTTAVGEQVPGYRNQQAPGNQVLGLTGLRGRLPDPRIRQALLHALDREGLIQTHAAGNARVSDSLLFAPDWATLPEQRYRKDPERARALLQQAGWKPGTPLRIVALTADTNPAVWNAVAEQWRAVGVDATVQLRLPDERARVLADPQVDAVIQTHLMPSPEPSVITAWVSCATAGDPNGPNPGGYCNPTLDRLLARGTAESQPAARQQAFREVAELLATELPVIPLWVPDTGLLMAEQFTSSPALLVPSTALQDEWGHR